MAIAVRLQQYGNSNSITSFAKVVMHLRGWRIDAWVGDSRVRVCESGESATLIVIFGILVCGIERLRNLCRYFDSAGVVARILR